MKYNKLILSIAIIALVLSIVSLFFTRKNQAAVYVDLNEVYSKYDYTIEMNQILEKGKIARKQNLDSLAYIIESSRGSEKLSNETIRELEGQYVSKQSYFESTSKEEATRYYNLIWDQINERTKDFAKDENIDLILGANGSGSLMFGNENVDKTQDLIEYLNNIYNGKGAE